MVSLVPTLMGCQNADFTVDVPDELIVCVGTPTELEYEFGTYEGTLDSFELAVAGLIGEDYIQIPEVRPPDRRIPGAEPEGSLTVTCSRTGRGAIDLLAQGTSEEEGTHRARVSISIRCVDCSDAGPPPPPDAGADAGPPPAWVAETFDAPLLRDGTGDVVESAGGPAAGGEPAIDQTQVGSEVEEQPQAHADHSFNASTYECGVEAGGALTVCASAGVLPMPEGRLFTFVMDLDGPVPLASSDRSFVYAVVLDSDGDAANDFVPLPAYPWDYYQGTDRWYELVYDHRGGGWSVRVTQLDASGARTEVPSTVRAVIDDRRVTFFVAGEELPSAVPAYRTTSFVHDGMYTQATRGGDVPFANPTLSLLPAGCGYVGVECGADALADCGAGHQCATEASRGVCIPAPLDPCGGLHPPCDAGETCITEGDAIGAPAYCVTDAVRECICAAAAGRHVFPGCS